MRHQVSVLHRTGRRSRGNDVETPCTTIRQLAADAEQAADVDELMGLEGAASTAYLSCLSGLVPPDVAFDGRSRRPPKDLANAVLSYAYTILLAECTGALLAARLETSLGVLHASTDKRPSLSLDLMEEFRPLLVDRTVLPLLRSKRLRPEHATTSPDGEGVWLNSKGKKRVRGDAPAAGQGRHARLLGHLAPPHPPRCPAPRAGHHRTRLRVDRCVVAMIVILAYDIASDTRRARLAAALEGWGYRLQESVFQLRLEPAELDEVRRQVTEIINQADDVIHLYPLCDSCLARSEVHRTAPALDDAGLYRGVW